MQHKQSGELAWQTGIGREKEGKACLCIPHSRALLFRDYMSSFELSVSTLQQTNCILSGRHPAPSNLNSRHSEQRQTFSPLDQNSSYVVVLVLAGIELIFFVVACMGLCFGFVLQTVLMIQGCFSYCWAVLTQHQGLFCFSPHSPASRLGVHKKLWGDTAGTADPNWPKGYSIPYDFIMLSNKSWAKKKEAMVFVFLSHHYTWWSPAFLEMAEHLPADAKQWMNSLFCFACVRSFCFTC